MLPAAVRFTAAHEGATEVAMHHHVTYYNIPLLTPSQNRHSPF